MPPGTTRPLDGRVAVITGGSRGVGFLTGRTIVLDGGLTIVSPLARLHDTA